MGVARAFLGLGSNLGNGPENLDRALTLIKESVGKVLTVSTYIQSEPWGFESANVFTNAVCVIETSLNPVELLDKTQLIEIQMGRTHKHGKGEAYTDRIIDIDILTYNNIIMNTERLTLPHPFIEQRDFVKIPLEECINNLTI